MSAWNVWLLGLLLVFCASGTKAETPEPEKNAPDKLKMAIVALTRRIPDQGKPEGVVADAKRSFNSFLIDSK